MVAQYFEVQVYDQFAIRGNAAIFKCQVPSFVADHVDVVGWIDSDGGSYMADGQAYGTSQHGPWTDFAFSIPSLLDYRSRVPDLVIRLFPRGPLVRSVPSAAVAGSQPHSFAVHYSHSQIDAGQSHRRCRSDTQRSIDCGRCCVASVLPHFL